MEYENDCTFLCKGEALNTSDYALIGKALASCSFGERVGIATDGGSFSKSIESSVIGALSAHSSHVWSFGESFLSQFRFFIDFCSLPCGVFISQNSSYAKIRICGRYGLPLRDREQEELENMLLKENFKRADILSCREVTDMSGVNMMYRRELIRQSDVELSELSCSVKCENRKISMLMEDCFYKLGCKNGDDMSIKINDDGTRMKVFTRESGWLSNDRILAIITNYETQNGRDVCVLPDAPLTLDKIAEANSKKVIRFYERDDAVGFKLLNYDTFMRDALFASIRLLKIIDDTGKSLARLNEELPDFYVSKRKIKCGLNACESLLRVNEANEAASLTKDGVCLDFERGKVRLSSINNGKELSIIAEASSFEASKDLCAEAEKIFNRSFKNTDN